MRTLILCRHAKSDWSQELSDFDRPLNERGKKDAPRMGKLLANSGFHPDLILSSPAKRAWETANKVAKELGYTSSIQTADSIYEASPGDILEIIHSIPENVNAAMLFGHNPGMEMTVRYLLGMGSAFHLPTCGMVVMETPMDWRTLRDASFSLKAFFIPRWIP